MTKRGPPPAPTVPAATLAHWLSISERRVQQLVKEGAIPKPVKRGQYVLEDCVRGYVGWLQQRVQHRDTANVTRDLREEQLRRLKAENDLADALVYSREDVDDAMAVLGQTITRLCDAISGRLTPLLQPFMRDGTDPSVVIGVIDSEQRRIRDELSSQLEAACAAKDARDPATRRAGSETSAEPKPRSVGRRKAPAA